MLQYKSNLLLKSCYTFLIVLPIYSLLTSFHKELKLTNDTLNIVNEKKYLTKWDMSDSIEAMLDNLVPELLKIAKVPGVSLAVIKNGNVILTKGYGFANVEKKIPVTTNTRFNIGSVSKTVTTWGILSLVERKVVSLDSPVNNYLKRWKLPESGLDVSKVTIRNVLSHTAGLSVRGYHGVYKPGEKLPTLSESLSGYTGSDGCLHLMYEPGTKFRYSSGAFTMLQMIIEDVTGQKFSDYIKQAVFTPLSMINSGYEWSKELQAKVATPYNPQNKAWAQYQYVEQGSGGMYTTASDLAQLISAFVGNETKKQGRGILSAQRVEGMMKIAPNTGGKGPGGFGMGMWVIPVSPTTTIITHDGSNEGWRALYMLEPKSGNGVVLMLNSDNGGRIGPPILCAIFEKLEVNAMMLCSKK